MKMQEIRDQMFAIADMLDCTTRPSRGDTDRAASELRRLAIATRRRFFERQRIKNRPSQALLERIREYQNAFPDAHMQEIASHLGVNIGRVSEALRGKRQ